jgi:hypothetical protein
MGDLPGTGVDRHESAKSRNTTDSPAAAWGMPFQSKASPPGEIFSRLAKISYVMAQ